MNCSLTLALLLALSPSRSAAQPQATTPRLPREDRVRIAEALRLVHHLGDRIWPGLANTPMPLLLVRDSAEFLIGQSPAGEGFAPVGQDRILRLPVFTRPRRLSPTMIATFPIGGPPTIVIGRAERTGKTSTDWVLTLLHEHFHQWQYTRPDYYTGVSRLDLSQGDSTGMWMLNYPFPYDSAPVAEAITRWAAALRAALVQPRASGAELGQVVRARDALRRQLSSADYRYLDFQLWQEGVARYIQYRTAQLAGEQGRPSAEFQALPDYRSYRAAAARGRADLLRELQQIDPRQNRRVSFYPLGAAIALLLEETRPDWKAAYSRNPFSLASLLSETSR
jgi:hypothetical protein